MKECVVMKRRPAAQIIPLVSPPPHLSIHAMQIGCLWATQRRLGPQQLTQCNLSAAFSRGLWFFGASAGFCILFSTVIQVCVFIITYLTFSFPLFNKMCFCSFRFSESVPNCCERTESWCVCLSALDHFGFSLTVEHDTASIAYTDIKRPMLQSCHPARPVWQMLSPHGGWCVSDLKPICDICVWKNESAENLYFTHRITFLICFVTSHLLHIAPFSVI